MKGGKKRTHTGGDGEGKGPVRDHPTPSPQTYTRRAEQQGGSDQKLDPEDGEGERGNILGYILTPEELRLKEVYGDWI